MRYSSEDGDNVPQLRVDGTRNRAVQAQGRMSPLRSRWASGPADQPDHEKSLTEYLDLIIERKWAVIVVFVACSIAAVVYAFWAPPLYVSTARIEIEHKRERRDKLFAVEEYAEIQRYLLTQQEVLRSRSLAEALVREMHLTDAQKLNDPGSSVFSSISEWFSRTKEDVSAEDKRRIVEEGVVNAVTRRIGTSLVRNSNIIAVSAEAESARAAQQMLEELLSVYLARNLENRRQESVEAAEWLKTEADKAERKLREAQSALVHFTVDHGIVDSEDGGLGQVLNLVNKTMEGHLKSLEHRATIQALKGKQGAEIAAGLPSGMKDELTAKLRQELAALESEYSQMQGVYSPSSPKMRMMQKRAVFLRGRIAELENKMVNTALDTAKTREELLKQSYEDAKSEADRVKSLESQYSLLKSAVDTAGEFHKILLREYKETEIKARTTSNNVRIVDAPSYPAGPSKPKKRLIILIGALAGLAGGIVTAFVIDALDQTVRDPREIEGRFETRYLGIVPDIRKLKPVGGMANGKSRYELLAVKYPQSPVSDAMKNIQASIFLSSLDDHVSSLAVSSATPEEGKTFLSVSLATVLATVSSKRVVLVDADMRKPRLHNAFALSQGNVGLSDFLGSSNLRLGKVVRSTPIEGLYLITAGSPPSDPVTLLQTEDMKALVGQLTAKFDYVIIDTPPVLGFADTPLICRSVDGLVLVVKHGSVRRGEVSVAIDVVQSVGSARIVGMVLNQVRLGGIRSYAYGYGHYYYRNYKYYRERQT